ncbi:MAG: DUF2726 domain-containing protein [Burkholderiales bacterium]
MSTLQMALIAIVVVLLLAWLWLKGRGGSGGGTKAEKLADRIDTVIGWPPQATRVLSTPERVAFVTLTRALPDYMILAQVPLSRFINVPKRNSYADWLRRVGYQCVDFVICDMAAQVVAVVELQPPQLSERGHKRLSRITRTLQAAQLPLHVWRENALPSVDAAREVLLQRLAPVVAPVPAKGVAVTAAATAAAAAVPTADPRRSPFEDTDRDSTQDEMIELLEPPPSTWFDDLDSDPVPLSKR